MTKKRVYRTTLDGNFSNVMRPISILFSVLLCSMTACSQDTADFSPTQTILFKITHPKSNDTSYLFGTHHAFGKPFFDSLKNTNRLLSQCNILITENVNIPGHLAEDIINSRTILTKWERFLNQKDLEYVNHLFASSPTNFNKMTPTEMYVFLNRYFKQHTCLTRDNSEPALSLDDYIGMKAEQQNIQLIGLETTEEQIELINKDVEGMPRKVHKKRLAGIIDLIRSGNPGNCAETDWYSQMEVDYQLNSPCRNTLMLTDRNNKWIETIKTYLESHHCFIAVGLSHLMYECGLIRQLQQLGYEITPVNPI